MTSGRTVHPHARGDISPTRLHLRDTGSPPRAWGRFADCEQASRSPVHPHARGDDLSHRKLRHIRAVHPHARGDDCGHGCRPAVLRGPPPRAWGRHPSSVAGRRPTTVHPHARGDDRHSVGGSLLGHRFTPTRVGTIALAGRAPAPRRSTPTRVGTMHPRAESSCNPVHPHARGDNMPPSTAQIAGRSTPTRVGTIALAASADAWRDGSPPRAWGRCTRLRHGRQPDTVHPHARGDITLASIRLTVARPVHPHARGDDTY